MSFYEITGGRPLEGRLRVQGAKNSVLPLLAAAILSPEPSVLHNCPRLSDVAATLEILQVLGCQVQVDRPGPQLAAAGVEHVGLPGAG